MNFLKYLLLLLLTVFGVHLTQASVLLGVHDTLNLELIDAFPANVFDSSCVGTSCPELQSASLCGSSLGTSEMKKETLRVLSECMKNKICGIEIDSRPVSFFEFSLDEVLPPGAPINGSCNTTKNDFFVNVVPIITQDSSQDTFTLSLPTLVLLGDLKCGMTITLPTYGLTRPESIYSAVTLNFVYNFTYSAKMFVDDAFDVSISPPNFEVVSVSFGHFNFPTIPGLSDPLPAFSELVKAALGNYSLPSALSNFYQSLVSSAFHAVATTVEPVYVGHPREVENCPT